MTISKSSSMKIEELGLPVRTETVLREAGIESVGDIVLNALNGKLLRVHNMGHKQLYRISDALEKRIGIRITMCAVVHVERR